MKHLIILAALDATEKGTDPIVAILGFFVIVCLVCFPLFVLSCNEGENTSGTTAGFPTEVKHDKMIAKDEEVH